MMWKRIRRFEDMERKAELIELINSIESDGTIEYLCQFVKSFIERFNVKVTGRNIQ